MTNSFLSATRSRRPSSACGFTLIELLVVVAIIALLIAILIPSLGKARSQAKMTTCRTNLHGVAQLLNIYANSFGSLPLGDMAVYFDPATGTKKTNDGTVSTRWYSLVQSTADSSSGTTWNDAFATHAAAARIRKMFICPEVGDGGTLQTGMTQNICQYTCHPVIMPDTNIFITYLGYTSNPHPLKLESIQRTDVGWLFDASLDPHTTPTNFLSVTADVAVATRIDNGAIFGNPSSPLSVSTNPSSSIDMRVTFSSPTTPGSNTDTSANQQNVRFRHLGDTKMNVLMIDGHVEGFTYNTSAANDSPTKTDFLRHNLYLSQ